MLRRAWKPIAATAAAGGAVYYFAYRNSQPTFKIPVRSTGPDGKRTMTTRTIPILSLKTIEERINQNATSNSHTSPGGIDWNYSTASLASNDPIEDANATQIVRRDDSDPSAPGDYLFFAVMDGHSGPHTSRLLSKVLTKAVALEISRLSNPSDETKDTPGVLTSVSRLIRGGTHKSISPTQTTRTTEPKSVSNAIVEAYERLDTELINAPLRILANNLDEESKKDKTIPDLSRHPLALTSMHPAVSGSCALMAIFDTANRDLYVACTGDSRAVAGVWEPSEDGKGQWRIEVLSEDQTGRNPNEAERYASNFTLSFSKLYLTSSHVESAQSTPQMNPIMWFIKVVSWEGSNQRVLSVTRDTNGHGEYKRREPPRPPNLSPPTNQSLSCRTDSTKRL